MSGSARVEVFRGETVESAHRVHVAVVDGLGNVVSSAGDARFMTFLRSAAKPFQALAAVEGGAADRYGLDERELALLCGSHAGEPGHVKLAESILHKAGLSASALRCGSHAPRTKAAKDALGGARATPLHHNCSGKHAGMLLLQRHLGGEPERYLDPAGPAQRAVLAAVARVAGVPEAEVRVATDGCSAPNFALPLDRAALLFARLAMPQGVPASTAAALGRLRDAMVRHPDVVAGRALFDADLMGAAEDRLVAKAGAEGVQGVGDLASGLGLALKVEDGAARAVGPATVEALRQLSWLEPRAFEVLGDWWLPMVENHAKLVVGRVKPVVDLAR